MYSILVVDDERWIRMGIVKMIDREANGIGAVYEAGTVQDAIRLYHLHHPQIVLTDVCFPTESGCTLGDYVYHDDPLVRIVLISAYSEFTYAQSALQFRASNYLLKPVSQEKLNQTIADCVRELDQQPKPAPPPEEQLPQAEPTSSAEIVHHIVERIGEDCTKRYSLSDLAKEYHISEAYLSHVFKKEKGISMIGYITNTRIEKACQLICTNRIKLNQIAQYVGFDDYQYFVRVFKKTKGITPSEYQLQVSEPAQNP